MGNSAVPFKRLSEETLPTPKVGVNNSHSTSVEMESLQQVNGDNKWHKTYTRFGTQAKGLTCGRFKPWITVIACCLIVSIAVVVFTGVLVYKFANTNPAPSGSFASKQDVLKLHLLINESLMQRLKDQDEHTGCNNSLILQLQDQVNTIQEQLKTMRSTEYVVSSQLDGFQRSLSNLTEQVYMLQKTVGGLTRKDSMFELDLKSVHGNVTELTRKVGQLEVHATNVSISQQDQERRLNLFHSNMSELVSHIQDDVSSISDAQDHFSEKISSLQHNVSLLGSQLNVIRNGMQNASSTSQDTTSLSNRLGQLENRHNTLSNQIHHPVNLYENCIEETANCSIDPDHSHADYWRDCRTHSLPLHKEVCICPAQIKPRVHFKLLLLFAYLGMVHHKLPM